MKIDPPNFAIAVLVEPTECHYCNKEIPDHTPLALVFYSDTDHVCSMHLRCFADTLEKIAMERYNGIREEAEQQHRIARHLWN